MKYWIIPFILELSGLVIGASLLYPLILITQQPDSDPAMVLAVASIILGFIGVFGSLANSNRLVHHKRILKKAGLWTDEYIKKKDLPNSEAKP